MAMKYARTREAEQGESGHSAVRERSGEVRPSRARRLTCVTTTTAVPAQPIRIPVSQAAEPRAGQRSSTRLATNHTAPHSSR